MGVKLPIKLVSMGVQKVEMDPMLESAYMFGWVDLVIIINFKTMRHQL
jgi:hypothetical protein